ncbi:MAG: 4-hydroxy-3-methylbut-2-enyl diphosphate reductase [Dehalococcoidales bacterium]|nr:4-hydroxy-3-methylbut-2-enyl diphosphate reductase [Dehalococcoidales bacterium]
MGKTSIEKARKTGFCFGVRRAINTLEKVAREWGGVETLGAVVHNEQVLEKLAKLGVRVAGGMSDIKGTTVVTSSHGVSPQTEEELHARGISVISTTCPFVKRAQVTARRLAEAGFYVIVYGDAEHPEVKGILGWAKDKGIATLEATAIATLNPLPRHFGILSQTTQIPAQFVAFVKQVVDLALTKDSEIRIIDTICHDIRERQAAALDLARKVDLMLVIGGRHSANTRHLAALCATATQTHQIETAAEIQPAWLKNCRRIGVTGGASTAEETVAEVMERLQSF